MKGRKKGKREGGAEGKKEGREGGRKEGKNKQEKIGFCSLIPRDYFQKSDCSSQCPA